MEHCTYKEENKTAVGKGNMRQTVLCVFSCGQKGETNVPSSVEQQTAHIWT